MRLDDSLQRETVPLAKSCRTYLLAAAFLAFAAANILSGRVEAQEASSNARPSTISVEGTQQVQLVPERIRLVLQTSVESLEAQEAIERLARRKEQIKKELVGMKAEEASITFRNNALSKSQAGVPRNSRFTNQIMMGMFPGGNELQKPPTLPAVYVASAILVVEWKLPSSDSEKLALLRTKLLEEIEKRDLAGKSEIAPLSEEDQEKVDDLKKRFATSGYVDDQANEQSQPQLLFVASVTPEKRLEATKGAFEAAEQNATQLASAIGKAKGKLLSINSQQVAAHNNLVSHSFDYYGQSEIQEWLSSSPSQNKEIINSKPEMLILQVNVNAQYSAE